LQITVEDNTCLFKHTCYLNIQLKLKSHRMRSSLPPTWGFTTTFLDDLDVVCITMTSSTVVEGSNQTKQQDEHGSMSNIVLYFLIYIAPLTAGPFL